MKAYLIVMELEGMATQVLYHRVYNTRKGAEKRRDVLKKEAIGWGIVAIAIHEIRYDIVDTQIDRMLLPLP